MKAVRTSNDAIVVPSSGPVYHGQAGQTRTERVHLVEGDGAVRSLEVYRVVNVTTDPELKPRALTGQLHRLPDGRELALPFVYHDPAARKFALVIPSSLAHLEMKEWARLMSEVAEDTSAAVPTYVRQGTTVLGLGALELFLEAGSEPEDDELSEVQESAAESVNARAHDVHVREQTLGEREKTLGERAREVGDQEQSMLRMAEDVTARERSLQRREEQLESERTHLRNRELAIDNARSELDVREQEYLANKAKAGTRDQKTSDRVQAELRAQQQASVAAKAELLTQQQQMEAVRLELHRSEQQIAALRTQLKVREQQLERVQAQAAAREREADVVPEGEWQDVALEPRAVIDDVATVVAQIPQPPPLPAIPSERGQPAISVPPPGAAAQRARARESTAPPAVSGAAPAAAAPVVLAKMSAAPAAAKARAGASQRPSRAPTTRPSEEPPRSAAPQPRAKASEPPPAAATSQRPSQRPLPIEPMVPPIRASAAPRTIGSAAPAQASAAPVANPISAPAPARMRSDPPPAAKSAEPPPSSTMPPEALTSADLRRRLDDPALRMSAIRELCRRGHPAAITPIFKVLGALTPEEVATTVVCMLALGGGVAGGLVEALESPSQDVRHAAALGLGQLGLSETLVPLLRRIETETTPSWTEMARALGDFGGNALSIVVGALPTSDRRERLMVGMAHLANHGCAEELKSLENDPDSSIALASRQALARCGRMEGEDVAVRTQQALRDNSPEARFSQVFFATLAAAG